MKFLILILLVGCKFPATEYVVGIHKIQQCQSVINENKKTRHKVCKELIYYECYYRWINHNRLKMFKNLDNANKYCGKLRNENPNAEASLKESSSK